MAVHTGYTVGGTKTPAANETKSLWLLNPAGDSIKVYSIAVGASDSAANKAHKIEMYRTTTLGTPAGTTATVVKQTQVSDAAAATTTGLINLTTEPTAVEVIGGPWALAPNGGQLIIPFPLGREPFTPGAGARIGLRYTNPAAGSTADIYYSVDFEE